MTDEVRDGAMFELPEQTQEVRIGAREFAQEFVIEGATERDQSHRFPKEIVQMMAENGFMGMFIPEEYGGSGYSVLDYVVALEEICYADAGVGVIMSVNNSLACWPIFKFGTEAQKQKYLVPMASGETLGCYALTEPEGGSDAAAQRTKLEIPDDGYILNGRKMWITNGPQADVCVTYANRDYKSMVDRSINKYRSPTGYVSAFILERNFEGYSVGKIEEKMGIACSGTSALVFDNLKVPKENLLGEEGKGFEVAMNTLDGGRIGIAAQALGIAQRAFDLAQKYAKDRSAFGKPISKLQAIQWMIADMATRIEAARLLTWKAATIKDREIAGEVFADRQSVSRACSMAKLYASECANFCADKALQIHGG
ncbi:MAG: acyl-CoA dehydrogenase family protein, partial [Myxococcota bacterium]|nr:acyl-CoA dehydrogenase family protein [Myxococcota bacterium]